MTHICVSRLTINGSYNFTSPRRRQAIIWTNAGILFIRPLGTKFSEILFRNQTFSFNKIHLKMSSAKWGPFCLGLNELTNSFAAFIWKLQCHWLKYRIATSVSSRFNPSVAEPVFIPDPKFCVSGLILRLRPANERRRYRDKVTP